MSQPEHRISVCMLAEAIGTYLLVFLGLGAVHSAVLTDSLTGLWQVGVVWGLAIMVAIYTVGGVSGAHINPAITIALASWKLFPRKRVVPYLIAQLIGAFLAAWTLFILFQAQLTAKEVAKGVERGDPGSIVTAMCYGEYFPSPGSLAAGNEQLTEAELQDYSTSATTSQPPAFLAEFIGTAILAFLVVAITDPKSHTHPDRLAPAFIGMTVTALICVLAPLTQACFNPARDFGPRMFAMLAGWGAAAMPGPIGSGVITVYIIAPIFGATFGAGLYHRVFRDLNVPETLPGRGLVDVDEQNDPGEVE
ncbi:MAG: aquaporin [Planctomycetaceae bacterium]|nr:aquaporin [Planctomycetaceae bacterium]